MILQINGYFPCIKQIKDKNLSELVINRTNCLYCLYRYNCILKQNDLTENNFCNQMPHQKLLSIRLRITNAHQHMHICYSHLNSLKGKHNKDKYMDSTLLYSVWIKSINNYIYILIAYRK